MSFIAGSAVPAAATAPAALWTMARAIALALAIVLVMATPAAAHIELVESDPPNVSTIPGPVEVITLTFSDDAEPVADNFVIEGPDGAPVEIAAVSGDGPTVTVTPASALVGGRHRVTWAIRSGDSHVMDGTIAFTVTASELGEGAESDTAAPIPATAQADELSTEPASVTSPDGAERVAAAGRWLVYAAMLFCVGGLGYLAWVHRGSAAEGRWLVFLIRRAGLVVLIGAIIEAAAQVVAFDGGAPGALLAPSAWGEVATAGFGTGTALRLLGAVLVLAFLRIDLDHTFVIDGVAGFEELSAADLALLDDRGGLATAVRTQAPSLVRLRVEASPMAFVGAVLLVVSESFIGHTATTDPRWLIALSDAGHLVAGGLWAAGATMLASTLTRRHRRRDPLDARLLATRFSVMAGWSLAAVAVTGTALAWGILDAPAALWQTTFGRILLAKVAVVAAIAAIGAYNHKVLVPALEDGCAGADRVEQRFRRTVTAESALFAAVLALTALLVASSAI